MTNLDNLRVNLLVVSSSIYVKRTIVYFFSFQIYFLKEAQQASFELWKETHTSFTQKDPGPSN